MDELLKKFIEELKEDNSNNEETRKYMTIIKRYWDEFAEGYEEGETDEKILKDFLIEFEDQENDNYSAATNMSLLLSEYLVCKKYSLLFNDNRMSREEKKKAFYNYINLARKEEKQKPFEDLSRKYSLNPEAAHVFLTRKILRQLSNVNMDTFSEKLEKRQSEIELTLRKQLIASITRNVQFLSYYGIIDNLIKEYNAVLEQNGLSSLKVRSSIWIPDEYGDGKGNFIKYVKDGILRKYNSDGEIVEDEDNLEDYLYDVGVLDALHKDYLDFEGNRVSDDINFYRRQKFSIEDLYLLDAFWRDKYIGEKLRLHNAIFTIKFADLWKTISKGRVEDLDLIDSEVISNANKRETAISYLCSYPGKIPVRIKTQYANFLKKNNLPRFGKIEDEVDRHKKYINSFNNSVQGMYIQESFILSNLLSNRFESSKWGVLDNVQTDEKTGDFFHIAIKNKKLRGPIVFAIPENWIQNFFGTKNIKFPKYGKNGKMNESIIMMAENLQLPISHYFDKTVRAEVQKNPNSELLSELSNDIQTREEHEFE